MQAGSVTRSYRLLDNIGDLECLHVGWYENPFCIYFSTIDDIPSALSLHYLRKSPCVIGQVCVGSFHLMPPWLFAIYIYNLMRRNCAPALAPSELLRCLGFVMNRPTKQISPIYSHIAPCALKFWSIGHFIFISFHFR